MSAPIIDRYVRRLRAEDSDKDQHEVGLIRGCYLSFIAPDADQAACQAKVDLLLGVGVNKILCGRQGVFGHSVGIVL